MSLVSYGPVARPMLCIYTDPLGRAKFIAQSKFGIVTSGGERLRPIFKMCVCVARRNQANVCSLLLYVVSTG